MQLQGKLVVLTGGSGGNGQVIAQRLLEEGAVVIVTGRSLSKLEAMRHNLELDAALKENLHPVVMDASDIDSILSGVQFIRKTFGKIDILVNNAGSAGPMQTLPNIPLSKTKESADLETLQDALESLLGFPWSVTCALFLQLATNASIINISTIFSKFNYYGRCAYTVPKAALNTLGHIMAEELGKDLKQIRVNTIYPGPVESERIHKVFAAMDQLKKVAEGTTEKEIFSKMIVEGSHFLSKDDIANAVLFLANPNNSGISGQDIEVANGLQTESDNTIEISLAPNPKIIALDGHYTWIIGGSELQDAAQIAQKHYDKGSEILLTFRDADTMKKALELFKDQLNFRVKLFDPTNTEDWKIFTRQFTESQHFPSHVFVLPHHSNSHYLEQYGESVVRIPLEKIQDYLTSEIADAVITGHFLSKTFLQNVSIVFVSNSSDFRGNKFDKIRTAAIEQLIRTWRYEGQFLNSKQKIWQLIRYNNEHIDNLDFTANLAISISAGITTAAHINIAIAKITQSSPFEFTYNQKYHQMLGNLDGTVTLITGGSEGIGRETARILVQGGSQVTIASRSTEKLIKTKNFLVKELTANGFPEAQTRINTVNLDVSDHNSVQMAIDEVIAKCGRIDFLINNAGITGQEQMIVDTSVDGWRNTLQANLLSNYDLIVRSLPYMKQQQRGAIVNISSAFGGQMYGTPAYPLRADYAVTKAGQRALSEEFAALIGPHVLINTISPGPVEGDRVRGGENRPGLYYRRAKINAENKRVNLVYDALIDVYRKTKDLTALLQILAANDISLIAASELVPSTFKAILESIQKKATSESCGQNTHLLTKPLAERLLERLMFGSYLPADYTKETFFKNFQDSPVAFLSDTELSKSAAVISDRAVNMLALGHMPTEYDIGREIVFNLSSKSMSGQTLFPSCGLKLENVQVASEMPCEFYPTLYNDLKIKTVVIIGNAMHQEMATTAQAYAKAKSVEKIIVIGALLDGVADSKILFKESLEECLAEYPSPDVIISFPIGPLPDGEELIDTSKFKKVTEEHLTNHFQVAKRAALIDNCHVFLVTHAVHEKSSKQTLAFAKFIATTLAPLTVTAGQECSRITHQASFYQINSNPYTDISLLQKKLSDSLLLLSMPTNAKNTVGHVITL